MNCLESVLGEKRWKSFVDTCKWHKSTGKAYFESLRNSNQFVNSQLNIVPAKNMTCNIGIGAETTHSVSNITLLNRGIRKVFFQKTHELTFPLKHPQYVVDDVIYVSRLRQVMRGNFWERLFRIRRIEGILYRVFPFFGKIGSKKLLARVAEFFG